MWRRRHDTAVGDTTARDTGAGDTAVGHTTVRRTITGGATRWAAWVVLGIVLVVALAIGASRPARTPTPAQRAATIDAALRCPSCDGISVADSSASTAVAIRRVVAERVRAGQSTAQIEHFLESRYGQAILLRPPASGASAAVWVVPLVAFGVAATAIGALFWRRRKLVTVTVAEEDRAIVEEALARARLGARPEPRVLHEAEP